MIAGNRMINYLRISVTDRCNFRCRYCVPSSPFSVIEHKKIARYEEILRITKGANEPEWSTFDAALVRAVDELYYDAIISDATWNVLSEHYNEKQLMDVIFTVGEYNMVSWALNSLGVQLEKDVPGFPKGSKK